VEEARREELRRLALWLSRRRQVDEAVEHLTAYGPAASERVHSHLDALKALLAAEQDAFRALDAAAPAVPQAPLPATYEAQESEGATIHSLAARRRLS
jgi:2-C-methyl-D-erythritol 4-phosphate cytidylyltransferase